MSIDVSSSLKHTILEQKQQGWNVYEGCYVSRWNYKLCNFHPTFPSYYDNDFDVQLRTYISMSWRKETRPSRQKWREDAINTGQDVPGSLVVSLPISSIYGHRNCKEISKLLHENINSRFH